MKKILIIIGIILAIGLITKAKENKPYSVGNLSNSGGSPTFRYKNTPFLIDNPKTTNDESNDQLTGYYGSDTVYACNDSSGNCYDLDADFYDNEVERLYFPKGGWVDIDSSNCDDDYCYLEDENGTEWEIERY